MVGSVWLLEIFARDEEISLANLYCDSVMYFSSLHNTCISSLQSRKKKKAIDFRSGAKLQPFRSVKYHVKNIKGDICENFKLPSVPSQIYGFWFLDQTPI